MTNHSTRPNAGKNFATTFPSKIQSPISQKVLCLKFQAKLVIFYAKVGAPWQQATNLDFTMWLQEDSEEGIVAVKLIQHHT